MVLQTAISTGFIYFIQSGEGGLIKIGFASDVQKRLKQLQTGNPDRLKLLRCIPGSADKERQLHKQFAEYREGGEWFHPGDRLLIYLSKIPASTGEIQTVETFRSWLKQWTTFSEESLESDCDFQHWHVADLAQDAFSKFAKWNGSSYKSLLFNMEKHGGGCVEALEAFIDAGDLFLKDHSEWSDEIRETQKLVREEFLDEE